MTVPQTFTKPRNELFDVHPCTSAMLSLYPHAQWQVSGTGVALLYLEPPRGSPLNEYISMKYEQYHTGRAKNPPVRTYLLRMGEIMSGVLAVEEMMFLAGMN